MSLWAHTLGFKFDFGSIDKWAIEDWTLLTTLVIEGGSLSWLVVRFARGVRGFLVPSVPAPAVGVAVGVPTITVTSG